MTRDESALALQDVVASAIAGGIHQLELVGILEAIKHSLLTQAYDANRPKPEIGKFKTFIDEGGKGEN